MKVHGAGRPPVVQDKGPVKSAGTSPVEKSSGERVAVSSLSKMLANVRAPDSPDVEKVEKLRELSPLWEMYKDGVDLNTIQWAGH